RRSFKRRRAPATAGPNIVAKLLRVSNRQRQINGGESAAALARAAFGANTAGTGADHFIAAAMRADDVHEHVPERFLHAIGVTAAVSDNPWFAIVWCVTRNHVENFFFACAREIRHWPIERFLFHLGKFLHRQLALAAIR